MAKKVFALTVIATLLLAGSVLAELSKTAPIVNHRQVTGEEVINVDNAIPYDPGVATDSPGEIVGYTFYDYQTNGSSGDRVALCNDGSKYFAFMKLFGWPYPPAPRHVYYNWIDPSGNWFSPEEGGQVSENSGSGYTTMDVIYGNRGAIAYHQGNSVIVSVEWDPPGMGFFDHYTVPNQLFPQTPESPGICMWPYIAVDNQNFIHIVASENTDRRLQRLGYTRSQDGGATWSTFQLVDTVMVIGACLAASPVSNKVAIGYPKTQDTSTQWNNDIVYYTSNNGQTWDWRYGQHNVTNYENDSDSLWAYTDMDILIDYNDNVHVLWNAQWVTTEGIYYRTFLMHYNDDTDQITTIRAFPDSLWTGIEGAWNRTLCKMNLGAEPTTNAIFATWTQFDTSDVSAGGFGNGDLYMSYSENGGTSWSNPVNMTNSQTPGCFPGECDSDHWSSLADEVDENLHVTYTNDKDAGGIPQDEGAATENPIRYLTFPTPVLGVDDVDNRPVSFSLNQNYPNPFNAKTTISFNLKEAGAVTVDVYDITGAKVATLVDGNLTAGQHQVSWDAADVASGVYYYKLSTNGVSETRQAVLIK